MHLRAITLAGFKTFARSTEIQFEDGVTAIVGPNGAGKTNIVDAFKWVLGEANARDLRGRRMEEVIYAGGERRPRAAFAEVALVIDNADRSLPVDYAEVAIRRRVDRGGESDYYLNGSRVRRRDLLELLASTGLTVDSYAIVNQSDIEAIVTCTPQERRQLLEEAARVRGVKAKRSEAVARLRELAQNLLRLEDLIGEIAPRLEMVRAQAEAAREAAGAQQRLGVLRGSLAWEEWREARGSHRRAETQVQALRRRLAEAQVLAEVAEADHRRWRLEAQAAQDRRLRRQEAIGGLRLELASAQHQLDLAAERRRAQRELAAAAAAEQSELASRQTAAAALQVQLAQELAAAESELAALPDPPGMPESAAAEDVRESRRRSDVARRAAAEAAALLTSLRTRRRFLEEGRDSRLALVGAARSKLPSAEMTASKASEAAAAAAEAERELLGKRAELAGLDSLRPAPTGDLPVLADVVTAEPGYDAALAAALGPLLDAEVAPDEPAALAAALVSEPQRTVLYAAAVAEPDPHPASLLGHVRCRRGYERLARRLLGQIEIGEGTGPRVTLAGDYREAGLVRRGLDARAELAARRRDLIERIDELEPLAGQAAACQNHAREAEAGVAELRSVLAQEAGLEEASRQIEALRAEEADHSARLPALEVAAAEAEAQSAELGRRAAERERILAEHRAEVALLELERGRWRDRAGDLLRQADVVASDLAALEEALLARKRRAAAAGSQADSLEVRLVQMEAEVAEIGARLAAAEADSPEEEAELAEAARRLLAVEEARVDCRLRVTMLEGNLGLAARDAELAQARMDEIRTRLPEGLAPDEVPGGKAREREIRALERSLEEIGPTNPLAVAECEELELRHRTLEAQLEDIAAARQDLEELIEKLRSEEESRYEAVFGAVAVNFQELFGRLSPGGRATLRPVDGEDGPRSGVEILVQPPRKRLQRATLLSSGERSLAALALVLALEAVNPSPFVILDEVDAALDDANVGRFGELVSELGRSRQFLVITHNHVTMAGAGALYGIHLDESGSSHVVSVRLEEVRRSQRRPAATA